MLTSAGDFTDMSSPGPAVPAIRFIGARADGTSVLVQLLLGPRQLKAGDIPFHGIESADTHAGDAVTGSFAGELVAMLTKASARRSRARTSPSSAS